MRRKVYGLAAVTAVAALALAGCSGGSKDAQSGGGADGSGAEGATDAVPAADINPHDRGDLEEGGSLRFAMSGMPTYWNPMHTNGNTVDTSNIWGYTSVANWIYNPDSTFEVNPNYVESYEFKEGDDAKNGKQEVVLHLNEKAAWNDGTPITWVDYEATWKACGKVEDPDATEDGDEVSPFECASTDGYSHWESVEQGDGEFDVVVTFREVFPDWSAALSTVFPAAGVSDAETFNSGWSEPNNDWLAGPFKVANLDDAQKTITLERNEKWWGEPALLESMTFREMDPAAMGTGFANGEIDVLDGIIDAQQYLQAETRADAEIRRAGGLQWRHFTWNGESGLLQDKDLRVAVQRGVDRAAITESDLAGIPDLVPGDLVLNNHFFMPGQDGYKANGEAFGYDPEKAEKELDDLGWVFEDGAEYRTKDGETLEFEYAMMPDVSTSKNEGELLQAQLKEIGVKVNIKNVDAGGFFDETVIPGDFGVTTFTWQGTPYPMANITQLYGCGDNLAQNGGSNFTRICVPEIEDLAEKVATTADHDKRLELANEADELIWENGMILPIYRRMEMTAVPSNLANFGAFGMSSVPAENIGFVKAD